MSEPITAMDVLKALLIVVVVCGFLIAFSPKGRR